MWFVYILRCKDNSFYTGVTTDLSRRLQEHNAGKGSAYTRSRRPVKRIFQERHATQASALKREAQIKSWPRSKKKQLL